MSTKQVLEISLSDKHKVADASAQLGHRVISSDVASLTGFSLVKTEIILSQLAGETAGTLEVDQSGRIVYRFRPGFRKVFLERRLKQQLKPVVIPMLKLVNYLARCFLALMLIFSPVCFLAFITLATMGEIVERRSSKSSPVLDMLHPFISLFHWRYHPDEREYLPSLLKDSDHQNSTTSFGYDIVTFLTGTGDRRKEAEEKRWQEIAALIRANRGVIIEEQLAPYAASKNLESIAITSILLRFNGYPRALPSGNIVYIFPSLQVSTQKDLNVEPSKIFQEKKLNFSTAVGRRASFLWSFALFNLVFYILLLMAFFNHPSLSASAMFLLTYITFGIFFALVPSFRWLKTVVSNLLIDSANKARALSYKRLSECEENDPALYTRLEEADKLRTNIKLLDGSETEYHTASDLIDQELGQDKLVPIDSDSYSVCLEPEFEALYEEAALALDQVSVQEKEKDDLELTDRSFSLIGSYKSKPIKIYYRSETWDYDDLTIILEDQFRCHLELTRFISSKRISEITKDKAVYRLFPKGWQFDWRRYRVFSIESKPIPEWFMDSKPIESAVLDLFRVHKIEFLEIRKGVKVKLRVTKIRNLAPLIECMFTIADRICSHEEESLAEQIS